MVPRTRIRRRGKEVYAAYGKDAEEAIADYGTDQLRFLTQHYDGLSAIDLDQIDKTARNPEITCSLFDRNQHLGRLGVSSGRAGIRRHDALI